MDPRTETRPYIDKNLNKYGIEWLNNGRISENFKLLIYGKLNNGKQIGLYGRKNTIIRLEEYDQQIAGITLLPRCATSAAAEAKISHFKNDQGICVSVDNLEALDNLLSSYFGIHNQYTSIQSSDTTTIEQSNHYQPDCKDLENVYQKFYTPGSVVEESKLFELYEKLSDKPLDPRWREILIGKCFKTKFL